MDIKDFGFEYIGKLKNKKSTEISSSRVGIGFETLDRKQWEPKQAWPVLNDLGVKWARLQSGWARTEKEKGVYDFAWLDDVVDNLLKRGVQPWISVSYGNVLYTPQASLDGAGFPPVYTNEEKEGWKNYVHALSSHYKGRVKHFEVWNEPDVGFFKPKADPALYVDLVRNTVNAIRSNIPDAFIVGGAFAMAMNPSGLKFVEECLAYGLGDYCDAISYHGYKIMPEQYLDQEYSAFRSLLNRYNPALEHWQGETGCPSYVPEGNKDALHEMQVSESVQARYLLRRMLLELSVDATVTSYFTMCDWPFYHRDGDLGYSMHYGIIRLEDGTPKPSYYALQSLATLLHNPLHTAGGATSFRMQTGDDENAVTREQAAAAYQVNLLRGGVPVQAYWLREELQQEPDWKSITMYYWLDKTICRLRSPVLIEPVSQDIYKLELQENYGMSEFKNLPISNSPLIITDMSLLEVMA